MVLFEDEMKGSELGQVSERPGNGLVGLHTPNLRSHHKIENDFLTLAQARQAVYKSGTGTHTSAELYIRYI